MQYAFILGNHPLLSQAELKAVLKEYKIVYDLNDVFIIETKKIDAEALLEQLGGTIKIVEIKKEIKKIEEIKLAEILDINPEKKNKFGFSIYHKAKIPKPLLAIGLEYKKKLKQENIKSRLVQSRENILSSVILIKEKCQDVVLIFEEEKIIVGKTVAVQKFDEYSKRDYGRPARDTHSGMLPPKLAKMMINLAQVKKDAIILDPFCGSGTILQEAMLMGYQNIIGSDISNKAIVDTKKNLEWLNVENEINVFQADANQISKKIKNKIDAIIAEVYLGPVKGEINVRDTKQELKKMYQLILKELTKILKPDSRLVIAFPAWRRKEGIDKLYLNFEELGYKMKNEYLYGRPDAQVLRDIKVLTYGQE